MEETFKTAEAMTQNYPHLAEWIDIGNSWNKEHLGTGYDMRVLKLTNSKTKGIVKPKLFITSSIHAREYTPAELNTRFAEHLVENYGKNADITWMLDYHEVHMLLQANPDGRKIAENQIMKRKNNNTDYCSEKQVYTGVDLNRNFAFEWDTGGSSDKPCSDIFHGSYAGSEPETQAIQKYLKKLFVDYRADDSDSAAPSSTSGVFLDIHSHSELILWPWGTRETPPANNLKTLGRKLAYSNHYIPKQSIGLYPTSGTTIDYAYGTLGVASYTFELGTSFFQECSVFENTIVPDNLPSLLYALKAVRAPYKLPLGPEVKGLKLNTKEGRIIQGKHVSLTANVSDTLYSKDNGIEPSQPIASAEYYIDTPPWRPNAVAINMEVTDGYFDTNNERIHANIDTKGLKSGKHIIFVRAKDQDNNWGVVSSIFLTIEPKSTVIRDMTKSTIMTPYNHKRMAQNNLTIQWKSYGASKHKLRVVMIPKKGGYEDVFRDYVSGNTRQIRLPDSFNTTNFAYAFVLLGSYDQEKNLGFETIKIFPPEVSIDR